MCTAEHSISGVQEPLLFGSGALSPALTVLWTFEARWWGSMRRICMHAGWRGREITSQGRRRRGELRSGGWSSSYEAGNRPPS